MKPKNYVVWSIVFLLMAFPHEIGHYIACKLLGVNIEKIIIDYLTLTFSITWESLPNTPVRLILVSGGLFTAFIFIVIHEIMKKFNHKESWVPFVFTIYQLINAVAEGFFHSWYMRLNAFHHIILLLISYEIYYFEKKINHS